MMGAAQNTGEPYVDETATLRQRIACLEALTDPCQQSEALFRGLLEAAPDAVVIVNRHGHIQMVNAQTEKIFDYQRHLLLGQPVELLIPERHRSAHVLHHADYGTSPRLRPMGTSPNLLGRRRDGSEFPVEISLSPMASANGLLVICTIRDITERKRLQNELLKARKFESLAMLAGGIAHDFNNILTAISGNISLAKMFTDAPGEIADRLTAAERACERATELTGRLLTFSRGDAPTLRTGSVAELIQETAGFAVQGSNVRYQLSIPDDLWAIEMDQEQMQQVIHNMILNAVQAMPNGGTVQIRTENITIDTPSTQPPQPERYVRISIIDQGQGIPAEHLSQVFDPYFITKDRGSGLDLATAYAVVNQHRGTITAMSELGTGMTFHIDLPASDSPIPTAPKAHRIASKGKGKILVIGQ